MVSRYGVKIRKRVSEILAIKNRRYECPKCGKKRVKRVKNALWECGACGYTFAGGAYGPETTVGLTAKRILGSIKPQ
ncbi:50S ribosomal protein L37ae [Candidatus Micrarchaeota archaeon]|nr:50S ribosomal protein L37ae [Candidatus Micrarchaeota archaeon]